MPQLAGVSNVDLLVDLGCGTGLSTRIWTDIANKIIGIDPSVDMIEYSKKITEGKKINNITYLLGDSSKIKLSNDSADIMTIIQAAHWMDPNTSIPEIHRVLKKNGILAVLNSDLLPFIDSDTSEIFFEFWKKVNVLGKIHRIDLNARRWDLGEHRSKVSQIGLFRNVREVSFHSEEKGCLKRFLNLCSSIGRVKQLLELGTTKEEMGLNILERALKKQRLESLMWVFCFTGFIAIKD